MTGIARTRWSEAILDECFRSILAQRPELNPDALDRTRDLMNRAVPDCLIGGFDDLIGGLALPDPDDRLCSPRRSAQVPRRSCAFCVSHAVSSRNSTPTLTAPSGAV